MRRRLLGLCLLAYPRSIRTRDREHLHDLALELTEDHGVLREAWGLLRGGLTERWRAARPGRRAVVAVVGAASAALAVLSWPAMGEPTRVEEDVFTCAADRCAEVEVQVAARVEDDWICRDTGGPTAVTWRCTRS